MADCSVRAAFYHACSHLSLADIDCALFTHLIYVPSSPLRFVKGKFSVCGEGHDHINTFAGQLSPSIKALLAVQYEGIGPHQPAYSLCSMAASLVAQSIEIARDNNFHGIHFTLETVDKEFLKFCARWREEAMQEARLTRRRPLLLTASFFQWSPQLAVAPHEPLPVDWLCLRAYHLGVQSLYDVRSRDRLYCPTRTSLTFSHTALHDCCEAFPTLTIHFRLRACLDAGVDPSALVLGLALHGFSFQLLDPSVHGMRAPVHTADSRPAGCYGKQLSGQLDCRVIKQRLPATDISNPSRLLPALKPATWRRGLSLFNIVAYKDIKRFVVERRAKCVHDTTTESAYCHTGTTWIGYDDPLTITRKVGYLKSMKLRGYVLDTLHEDTPEWDLSKAATSSLLAVFESPEKSTSCKGKGCKGIHKSRSRSTKEIIDFGLQLSSSS